MNDIFCWDLKEIIQNDEFTKFCFVRTCESRRGRTEAVGQYRNSKLSWWRYVIRRLPRKFRRLPRRFRQLPRKFRRLFRQLLHKFTNKPTASVRPRRDSQVLSGTCLYILSRFTRFVQVHASASHFENQRACALIFEMWRAAWTLCRFSPN